ncbi:Protein CBG15090 [Caenorhabditis briggsae]|uniref:Protein CBG15090 n=1 Tax=Caenorhabditis briggsae TaxID=6238 RepID=A8XLD1_CAEBR|nr:Protein CBG15090 [Caenorhabditis briggsae]CAP33456.2 Protein CBG15090 [Caenorhabditis briggsae]
MSSHTQRVSRKKEDAIGFAGSVFSVAPLQYFKFPKLPKCNYIYNNATEIIRYEVFKPNTIEYVSNAHFCKKIVSEVSLHTDLSGYEHLVEKEINNKAITKNECEDMIKNKYCEFGRMKKGDHSYLTNNKIEVDYPNRFTSLFRSKRYLKENCILIETKIFSHYDQKYPTNVLADMTKCNYLSGSCQLKSNEIMLWDVNKDQNCKFISIGKFDGFLNDNLWINNENQIALNLQRNKTATDCNNQLYLSSEGFAFCKEIDANMIEYVDLSHFDGYKLSLALTKGQIPIRIKKYRDKIWYYKNDIISNKLQLSDQNINQIKEDKNVTTLKNIKHYNLKFLNKKDFFGGYYIYIWRIYVSIGVTVFYVFIIRTIWLVLSPKFLVGQNKSKMKKVSLSDVAIELFPLNQRNNLIESSSKGITTSRHSIVVD